MLPGSSLPPITGHSTKTPAFLQTPPTPPVEMWNGCDMLSAKACAPPTPLWKCGMVFCAERRVRDVASRSGIKRRLCMCRRSMIIRKQPDLKKE